MLWCVVLCVHVSTIILYVCVYVCPAGDRKLTVICLDVQHLSSESESFSVSFMLTNCVYVCVWYKIGSGRLTAMNMPGGTLALLFLCQPHTCVTVSGVCEL